MSERYAIIDDKGTIEESGNYEEILDKWNSETYFDDVEITGDLKFIQILGCK